jgi:DNA-binding transcriptional ArsR family regulator
LSDHEDPGVPAGGGDADLSVVGAVLADRSRCKILLALADGRALPAGVLASEAGFSAAIASSHLNKLSAGGMLEVFRTGRVASGTPTTAGMPYSRATTAPCEFDLKPA